MTTDELNAWIRRRQLDDIEAADQLALSRSGLKKQRLGIRPVGPQTARIAELLDQLAPPP